MIEWLLIIALAAGWLTSTSKMLHLRATVSNLYYAARWRSDNLTSEVEANLWEQVRDACELPPGGSPK